METKQIKISELVPQGWEIDLENSTILNIILKPIEVKLPLSVEEIPDRRYFIDKRGCINEVKKFDKTGLTDINNLSTENRAIAFLALMQLVELRDAWNGDWRAEWQNSENKYCLIKDKDAIRMAAYVQCAAVLHFKTKELAEKFLAQFEDLINEAKELL